MNLDWRSTTRKILREDCDVVFNGVLSMLIDHDLVEGTAVPIVPPFLDITM
jgi:lipopolysaccharide biosynthesis glycosyltransferase